MKKTPAIMLQGVSSNAGKSVLAAGLCRLLLRRGYRVAPFKAQNMSLNSAVTPCGGEMGRAQVTQAEACRLAPRPVMNPILLKPTTDMGSQVIVLGKATGHMQVREYVRAKAGLWDTVRESYDSLAREYDVIVLEGAGSPAEINLKSHDIVNMAMARYARARVLLCGDIDRGGVFAHFYGTHQLLPPEERELIKGFVINRFRGDASLLDPAMEDITRLTGVPFAGVVPHFNDLELPEEDSVSLKEGRGEQRATEYQGPSMTVAVTDLPRISNFTDLDELDKEPDVRLVWIRTGCDLERLIRESGPPHAVIIPGSRSTASDMAHLEGEGVLSGMLELAAAGRTEMVGICGGLQMFGTHIADPERIESDGAPVPGMGILPVTTIMERDKKLRLSTCLHPESGLLVEGYEIHHGSTEPEQGTENDLRVMRSQDGRVLGVEMARKGKAPIWGTYLHGIFARDDFRRWFIDRLRVRSGAEAVGRPLYINDLEGPLNRLAERLEECLDMDLVLEGLPRR